MLWLRFAFKEIVNNWKFSTIFCLNLTLGVLLFLVLDGFGDSYYRKISESSKGLLGADISIRAVRPLTDDERRVLAEVLPTKTQQSETLSFYTMIRSGERSRLVRLVAIDDQYPFYGEIQLERGGSKVGGDVKDITRQPHVWLYPELRVQLGVSFGDKMRVGERDFLTSDIIVDESASAGGQFSLAPTVSFQEVVFSIRRSLK